MRHERFLAFTMITLGCTFATVGRALAAQRPDATLLAAIVGTLGRPSPSSVPPPTSSVKKQRNPNERLR
jgi:hypothetical protein